jgi:anti-sigma factor RsiW
MTDEPDDADLVALIDGELEDTTRKALAAQLASDPELRARFERLAAGGLPFRPAFQAALDEAPIARMRAKLDALGASAEVATRWPARIRRIGVAVAAVALILLGWAIGRYAPLGPGPEPASLAAAPEQDRDDWRQAIADYISLYSAETLALVPSGGEAALLLLSDRLGVPLNAASVALPNLTFKRAQMLSYDGAPLGQVAYLDEADRPAAFCIIRNGAADAPVTTEERSGLALASWARDGRGYVVIGRFSIERAAALANTLALRF